MTGKANYSKLPPLRDVAEMLRDGVLFDEVCTMYDTSAHTLTSRLNNAGYGNSGHPLRVEARTTGVLQQGEGPAIYTGGVGGGDYLGLPLEVVPHTRRRKQFLGLDWSTSPATGPLWKYV